MNKRKRKKAEKRTVQYISKLRKTDKKAWLETMIRRRRHAMVYFGRTDNDALNKIFRYNLLVYEMTEAQFVDYLFLDDLGKESRKGDSQNNEWTHQILYEILDNRSNTIINTNLSSKEIKALYADNYGNGALSSRILEGVTGNSFAYPKDMEDRRY